MGVFRKPLMKEKAMKRHDDKHAIEHMTKLAESVDSMLNDRLDEILKNLERKTDTPKRSRLAEYERDLDSIRKMVKAELIQAKSREYSKIIRKDSTLLDRPQEAMPLPVLMDGYQYLAFCAWRSDEAVGEGWFRGMFFPSHWSEREAAVRFLDAMDKLEDYR